jgi:hypothetical protein
MNNQNQFYKLLMGCPFGHSLCGCIIERYRKMSITELIDDPKLIDPDYINFLLNEHAGCLKIRNGQKVAS